jgi:hypothetical protein
LSGCVLLERNREGVIVRTNNQDFTAVGLFAPTVHGLIGGGELFSVKPVLRFVAGEDKVARTGPEDRENCRAIVSFYSVEKCGAGSFGCGECFRSSFGGRRRFRRVTRDE